MQAQRLSPDVVQQVRQYLAQGYRIGMEHADKRRYRSGVWETCTPIKDTREQAVFEGLERCLSEHQGEYVRIFGIDPKAKQRIGMVTVQRPGDTPIEPSGPRSSESAACAQVGSEYDQCNEDASTMPPPTMLDPRPASEAEVTCGCTDGDGSCDFLDNVFDNASCRAHIFYVITNGNGPMLDHLYACAFVRLTAPDGVCNYSAPSRELVTCGCRGDGMCRYLDAEAVGDDGAPPGTTCRDRVWFVMTDPSGPMLDEVDACGVVSDGAGFDCSYGREDVTCGCLDGDGSDAACEYFSALAPGDDPSTATVTCLDRI